MRQCRAAHNDQFMFVHVFGPGKKRITTMTDQDFDVFLGQQQLAPVFPGAQLGIAIQICCFVKQPVHFGAIPWLDPPETGSSPVIQYGGSAYSGDGHRH
jgi:hypothetical protein